VSSRPSRPATRRETAGDGESSSAVPGGERAGVDPTATAGGPDNIAAAAAIAAAVGAGASVLVVGTPPPGLGDALDARSCKVTLLGPPAVDETWAGRVGGVDEVRPDPGSLDDFDAVVAPHLLDLAADPATALRRMAGALRAKGLVVLVASGPAPPGALHRHDADQVERLCQLAGLAVQAVTRPAGAATSVVVARRPATAPTSEAVDDREPQQETLTTAVDRRLRDQQARIRALEDEVRALRTVSGRPRIAALVARGTRVGRVARAVRTRMRARG